MGVTSEHVDVIVVGAGLSGVGAAYRLQTRCPGRSYAVLEARQRIGGTWDLFRYPGVRSDSDMFTLGFEFNPWQDPRVLASGDTIRTYVEETAAKFGIDRRIRFGHRVTAASWDSASATWTVRVDLVSGGSASYTCNFLYLCSGYYSYDAGYSPDLPGIEDFAGRVVHPQFWPEDLDYAGRRVVIIGSGATAVTLVPAMAETAGHVTMLQRSPTYIFSIPGVDQTAATANRLLPGRLAHKATRMRRILMALAFYQFCRRMPDRARRMIAGVNQALLPDGYPLDPDFAPRYKPWDQRVCFVPDGDLFRAIREGRASVVTATIDHVDASGVLLSDGRKLPADIVITATGLQVLFAGGISVEVDGSPVDLAERHVYRGFMLSGVPNFAFCVGYTNASWTLRADLSSQMVCKVLNYMDAHGKGAATPRLPAGGGGAGRGPRGPGRDRPILDLTSGYVQRAAGRLPKSGERRPWRVRHNYLLDFLDSRFADVTRDMDYTPAPTPDRAPGDQPRIFSTESR